MKTRRLAFWMVGWLLALVVPAGLAQNTATSPSGAGTRPPTSATSTTPNASAPATSPLGQAFAPATSVIPDLSPWAGEMAKLAHAGIEENVMLSFIDNAAGTFNLTSDDIIYLRDIGISSDVITAMMQHDAELAAGLRPVPPSSVGTTARDIHLFLASANTQPTTVPTAKTTPPTAPPPAPAPAQAPVLQQFASADVFVPDLWQSEPNEAPAQPARLYPVREPYPVKLTDPILVIRGEGRVPNLFILQTFP